MFDEYLATIAISFIFGHWTALTICLRASIAAVALPIQQGQSAKEMGLIRLWSAGARTLQNLRDPPHRCG